MVLHVEVHKVHPDLNVVLRATQMHLQLICLLCRKTGRSSAVSCLNLLPIDGGSETSVHKVRERLKMCVNVHALYQGQLLCLCWCCTERPSHSATCDYYSSPLSIVCSHFCVCELLSSAVFNRFEVIPIQQGIQPQQEKQAFSFSLALKERGKRKE